MQSTAHRVSLLNKNDRPYNVVISQQFEREHIDSLCKLADMMRNVSETKPGVQFLRSLLSHKRAMIYFTQPSTRTFLSFAAACQIVGMPYNEVRNASVSSESKGESEHDTVKVLSQYFDAIIMRHPKEGFAEDVAHYLDIPIINGGSGKDQHPTQALLDIYTLKRSFGGDLNKKFYTFVGDLKRGRTVRSLAYLLCKYAPVRLEFVAPPELQMEQDILDHLTECNVGYDLYDELTESIIERSDAIYMTRLQDEHDEGGESKSIDYYSYALTRAHQPLFKKHMAILHPLPRRQELDRALDDSPNAKYWEQVKNGMWMRAALLIYVFGVDSQVISYYHDEYMR